MIEQVCEEHGKRHGAVSERHGRRKADAQESAPDPRERRAVRKVGSAGEHRRGGNQTKIRFSTLILDLASTFEGDDTALHQLKSAQLYKYREEVVKINQYTWYYLKTLLNFDVTGSDINMY